MWPNACCAPAGQTRAHICIPMSRSEPVTDNTNNLMRVNALWASLLCRFCTPRLPQPSNTPVPGTRGSHLPRHRGLSTLHWEPRGECRQNAVHWVLPAGHRRTCVWGVPARHLVRWRCGRQPYPGLPGLHAWIHNPFKWLDLCKRLPRCGVHMGKSVVHMGKSAHFGQLITNGGDVCVFACGFAVPMLIQVGPGI